MNLPTRYLNLLIAPALALALATPAFAQDVAPAPTDAAPVDAAPADTSPTTAPSADAKAEVTPEAQAILDQLKDAYAALKSASLDGTISATFDVAGKTQNESTKFTAKFAEPNLYRHEVEEGVIAGSTGEKAYVYNKSDNAYLSEVLPIGAKRFDSGKLPRPHGAILHEQNPSMALALSNDAAAELIGGVKRVEKADDVAVDGKSMAALKLAQPDGVTTLVQIDPATHLVRRVTHDLAKYLEDQGVPDVKVANITIDYPATRVDESSPADQYAWAPPEGAQEASLEPAGGDAMGSDAPAMQLVGQPAPDFTLDSLAGEPVKLSDVKGKVVVLDFWATWCGPCVASMPNLQRIDKEMGPQGVKVLAVNQQEDKPTVEQFMKANGYTMTALLDYEGKAGAAYKVQGIPQTVVIGKDGVVKKVFIGMGPNLEEELTAAINEALKG